MTIDWAASGIVAVVSILAATVLGLAYSTGVRLLAVGRENDDAPVQHGPASVAAIVCFAICAAAVLFGLWLIIPQFHSS